jgi:hypothetical protein
MPGARAREVEEHPAHRDRGQGRDDRRPAREEPEGDAGVRDVTDLERPGHVHGIAEVELADDDLLGHLVGDDRGEADGQQREPVERGRGERPLDHRDRHAPIGGRSDANVDQPRRRVD